MLSNESTIFEFFAESFEDFVEVADRNIPTFISTLNEEAIHDFRVALRKLRTIIRYLSPLLNAELAHNLKRECDWVDQALATFRNSQVLYARIANYPANLRAAAVRDTRHLESRLREETMEFSAFIHSSRFMEFQGLTSRISSDSELILRPEQSAREILEVLNKKLWHSFEKKAPTAKQSELHEIRILAKRVNYLATASQPVVSNSLKKHIKIATKAQKLLGELQDSRLMRDSVESNKLRDYEAELADSTIKEWKGFLKKYF
jgi:CHAD domain-containing protein